jgi:hypothetical protein
MADSFLLYAGYLSGKDNIQVLIRTIGDEEE